MLRPFVSEESGSAFSKRVRRSRKKIAKRAWLRWRGNAPDELQHIDDAWKAGHSRYDLAAPKITSPWLWKDRRILLDENGIARLRGAIIAAVIRKLKPRRVLDIGCGDGIYPFLLAGAFPDIEFTGIELSEGGHKAAMDLQALPALPDHLARYNPLEQLEPEAYKRIKFVHGDACAMPFAPGEFDLAFTVGAIAQMKPVKDAAMREISRVTGGHLLTLEMFRDVNHGLWRRLNLVARDFTSDAISDLQAYQFEPIWATADFPQDALIGTALVLSRKI